MAYYQANKTFETSSTQRINVFEYRNSTKLRLFCNRLDLLPDVFFSKYGIIEIYKNGILEYTNEFQNDLERYSHYSVRQRLRWLERDEDLKIYVKSKKEKDIKITMAITLDWTDEPQAAILIPFTQAELSSVAEQITLFSRKNFDTVHGSEDIFPFDVQGYKKLIISLEVNTQFHPIQIYNDTQNLSQTVLDLIDYMYWGTATGSLARQNVNFITAPPRLFRTSNQFISWTYSNANQVFRTVNNDVINPEAISGTSILSEALYELFNAGTYNLQISSANTLAFDKTFQYVSRFNFYAKHEVFYANLPNVPFQQSRLTARLIYSLTGKRVVLNAVYQLVLEGYNNRDFSDEPEIIKTLDNYTGVLQTILFTTDRKYVRIQKKISYTFTVTDKISSHTIEEIIDLPLYDTDFNSKLLENNAIINALPLVGQAYQTNRIAGWEYPNWYSIIPYEYTEFLKYTGSSETNHEVFDIESIERDPLPETNIKISLQAKGVNDQWFTVLDSIGEIKPDGKTLITLSEFDIQNVLTIPQGQNLLRFVVFTDLPIELSMGVNLTN